jgi:hypothetical protein
VCASESGLHGSRHPPGVAWPEEVGSHISLPVSRSRSARHGLRKWAPTSACRFLGPALRGTARGSGFAHQAAGFLVLLCKAWPAGVGSHMSLPVCRSRTARRGPRKWPRTESVLSGTDYA